MNRFKVGDIVKLISNESLAASVGAKAIVTGCSSFLYVEWIRDGFDNGQMDGGYDYKDFEIIGLSNPNSDIIIKETG